MEELKASNWNKPSNKKLKFWADVLLYCMPLYLGAIMALEISDTSKMWINFVFSTLVITLKAIVKFTKEDGTIYNNQQNPSNS